LTGYYLASAGAGPAPGAAPPGYVRSLFDDYAEQFDEHLVKVLRYRGHTALAGHLEVLHPARFSSALDLGCGTGLFGALVESKTDRLTGVDLSGQMLSKARNLGIYERLAEAEIVQFLLTADETFDLVAASDVLIYLGDLAPLFEGVRRVTEPGGIFCFSAEVARPDAGDFELLPSLRYAHSEAYIRRVAERHGFDVAAVLQGAIREDQRQAITGMYVYLRLR